MRDRNDPVDGSREVLAAVRRSYAARGDLAAAVDAIAEWLLTLAVPSGEADDDAREWIGSALAEPGLDASWMALRNGFLPNEFRGGGADGPSTYPLNPVAGYCLGRAAMRAVMRRPFGSRGLARAYRIVSSQAWFATSWDGADDELSECFGTAQAARAEVDAEAIRLRENPSRAAARFDRTQTAAAIAQAASPVSLEACAHWQVRDLPVDHLSMRVIQVIAALDPKHAAGLLDVISNPALVASALRGEVLEADTLAQLLQFLGPVFASDNPTGATSAWMVLLEFEDRLIKMLPSGSSDVAPGREAGTEYPAAIGACVARVCEALAERADGPRLATEWLARLMWSCILGTGPGLHRASGQQRREALLASASRMFRENGWTGPVRLWSMFGGSPVIKEAERARTIADVAPEILPDWFDWRGVPSRIVPLAVAAQQWDGDGSTAAWIAAWLGSALLRFRDDPALSMLADGNPPRLAGMLARPLAYLPDAASVVAGLWREASPVRLRARFLDVLDGNHDAQSCRAVVRIGLSVLAWSVRVPGSDPVRVAHLIADAVDEVRYCHPDTGLDHSDALAGALTAAMATACILDQASLQWLCRRFDGDDGSLAAMAANALANGIAVSEVRAALSAIGEDAAALVARWKGWNGPQTTDSRGELTPMATLLARLHEASS